MRRISSRLPVWSTLLLAVLASGAAEAQQAGSSDGSNLDWNVGLRGSYGSGGGADKAELIATPNASLLLRGSSGAALLSSGAELRLDSAGNARASDLHLGVDASYQLGALTTLFANGSAALTQADADDSSLPANTLTAPLVFTGTAAAGVTQKLDLIDIAGRVHVERVLEGPTTLDDLSQVDNGAASFWRNGAGLRLGYEVTPRLSVFVDGDISQQTFDAPLPGLLVPADNSRYELRAGLGYTEGSMLSGEVSIGRAWLDYVEAGLADSAAWVADATVSFTPDDTTRLGARLATSLAPSDSVEGDTDVAYALSADASHAVNSVLTLRGSAGATRTVTLGSGAEADSYFAGAGLDLATSRHAVWSADYLFEHSGSGDRHTVSVGVNIRR